MYYIYIGKKIWSEGILMRDGEVGGGLFLGLGVWLFLLLIAHV